MHNNYTLKMLDIQGGITKKIEKYENSIYYYLETRPKYQICPHCNCKTNHVHDYRTQKIEHLAMGTNKTYLILRKRRYVCPHCHKKFYENYSFLQKYFRKSNNLINKIINDTKQQKSLKTIAEDNNTSIPTVNRYINYEIFLQNKSKITTFPKHIGIDEFKGNSSKKDKYQVQITDLDTHKVIDIVESRSYDTLERYFSQITNRNEVEIVSMDLYLGFKRIVKDKFPKAQIVADKFHYTRIVLNVLDQARIDIERNMSKPYRRYFKGIKRIIMKRSNELKDYSKERLLTAFELSPELKKLYDIKEEFLKINDTIGYQEKEKLFRNWIFRTESICLKYFKSCLKTLRNWHKYISNSFKYNISNGIVEGTNNKIKVLKRVSYGFRNFKNFRNRILIACS